MYMDIKILAKLLETLIQTKITIIQDIGMEFGIEKFAMFIIKNGKQRNE